MWEALIAIGTLVTAVIIGVSAFIALQQIHHLRIASQLESCLALMAEATSPQMAILTDYVETVLPRRLREPKYRSELEAGTFDFQTHQELVLGGFWEKIGSLMHFGLFDSDALIDFVSHVCPYHWTLLREVAELRRAQNPIVWKRFEELAARCEEYLRSRGAVPPSERVTS